MPENPSNEEVITFFIGDDYFILSSDAKGLRMQPPRHLRPEEIEKLAKWVEAVVTRDHYGMGLKPEQIHLKVLPYDANTDDGPYIYFTGAGNEIQERLAAAAIKALAPFAEAIKLDREYIKKTFKIDEYKFSLTGALDYAIDQVDRVFTEKVLPKYLEASLKQEAEPEKPKRRGKRHKRVKASEPVDFEKRNEELNDALYKAVEAGLTEFGIRPEQTGDVAMQIMYKLGPELLQPIYACRMRFSGADAETGKILICSHIMKDNKPAIIEMISGSGDRVMEIADRMSYATGEAVRLCWPEYGEKISLYLLGEPQKWRMEKGRMVEVPRSEYIGVRPLAIHGTDKIYTGSLPAMMATVQQVLKNLLAHYSQNPDSLLEEGDAIGVTIRRIVREFKRQNPILPSFNLEAETVLEKRLPLLLKEKLDQIPDVEIAGCQKRIMGKIAAVMDNHFEIGRTR